MKVKIILILAVFSVLNIYAQDNKERGYIWPATNDYNPQIVNMSYYDHLFRMKEIESDNAKADVCLKTGNDLVQLKKYNEAVSEYTKAIKINNNFPSAYYNRGLVEIFLGLKEDGCLDLKKAAELGEKEANKMIQKYCDQKEEQL
jgi:tetratricopeptide (TPR) repeat protein